MCPINSDEHSAKRYARSGPEQPLAPEQRDKPGASSSQQSTEEKQRGDVKRAGASARTSEHDRASTYLTSNGRSPPTSHASHDFAVLAPLRDRLACSVHLSGSPRGEGPGAPLSVTPKIDTFIDENMRGDFEYFMEICRV